MSSFKRKTTTKPVQALPGTRLSPATPSTTITSTGIPSLDDILGGGLPLSCSLLVLAPDHHSSYGELVQKYFIAQGLSCGQYVCVVGDGAEEFVRDSMWTPPSSLSPNEAEDGDDGDGGGDASSEEIKIAWRYANMKQFQTTVGGGPSSSQSDEFCQTFDLTNRIPRLVISQAVEKGRLSFIEVTDSRNAVLDQITELLKANKTPVRICVRLLGSPEWGEVGREAILRFLHSLRSVLRRFPHGCASLTLPSYWSSAGSGGVGWLQKLGWVSDAAVSLEGFSGDPSLSGAFPLHHGLVQIHSLPAPHTLLPPSDRYSTLRGMSSSTGRAVGCGENNLGFKCTRKRLIIETLHLDVEGGVSERRTTNHAVTGADAAVAVDIEASRSGKGPGKKEKKKVGFRTDRGELYEF